MRVFVTALLFLFLLLDHSPLAAKVDPPNFNFTLEVLGSYLPGASLKSAQATNSLQANFQLSSGQHFVRFLIRSDRYRFPLFVQTAAPGSDQIIDLYVPLPSYFSHDLFLQSLINRYGAPGRFFAQGGKSIYLWPKVTTSGGMEAKIRYAASCTITCFPHYFSISRRDYASSLILLLENDYD